MRIAYICADIGVPVFGHKGCSVHVQEIVRGFRRLGAEVELFAARTEGEPPRDLSDVRTNCLPAVSKNSVAERENSAFEANTVLTDALRNAGKFDFVYERYSLWSCAAMLCEFESYTPRILEVNSPLVEEQAEHRGLVNRKLAEQIREKAFLAADAIIAISDEVAEYVERFAGRKKIHVLPNGVDPSRFQAGRNVSHSAERGIFTIGFVGTLKPWHGLENLIEAFERLYNEDKSYRLLIVGDGPERTNFEEKLRSKALSDAVCFAGAVKHAEVPNWLASMDAAVSPYAQRDGFYFSPLKVYEYMAASLPVVSSDVGQLANIIQNGTNGLLVTPGDSRALAGALKRLRNDASLRNRLGTAARKTVIAKHTWQSVASRIVTIAQRSADRKHAHITEVTA